eukprot:TRINITY_DN4010_c0_g1_i1.p1 TRINITY_DN4010_c0_g1~~TRINITY_DN4010_c0_g1_i1.p1  ORF type:complete len:298 (+),score=52.78 TRINITY_DN4010_c0_g1_i1:75-896(+)
MYTVNINCYQVGPQQDDTVDISSFVSDANSILNSLGFDLAVRSSQWITDALIAAYGTDDKPLHPLVKEGTFYPASSMGSLVANSRLHCETDVVDVYFIDKVNANDRDIRGQTVSMSQQYSASYKLGDRGFPAPTCPVIFLNLGHAATLPETLAHELGHALLDDGGVHEEDPNNLMAAGSIRTGTELTLDQLGLWQASPLVIAPDGANAADAGPDSDDDGDEDGGDDDAEVAEDCPEDIDGGAGSADGEDDPEGSDGDAGSDDGEDDEGSDDEQ